MMKCDCAKPAQPKQLWTKHIRELALVGALGSIALASIAPGVARAEDSGESSFFGSMLKSLGIGGDNNIEYRERPPLVVPPNRDLPPPQTSGKARDPNWPLDPKSAGLRKKADQVRDLDRLPVPQRPVETGMAGAGAPTRKSLTEPPADYESPSPSQPYGTATPAPAKSTTPESALQTPPGTPGL